MAIILKPFTGEPQYKPLAPRIALGASVVIALGALSYHAFLRPVSHRIQGADVDFGFAASAILSLMLAGYWWNQTAREDFGREGERHVSDLLEKLPDDYVVLNSVVLPFPEGTFEIDHLVLAKSRGFVIETKSMSGSLRGDPSERRWTKTKMSSGGNIYAKTVNNPIKQNAFHINKLREWFSSGKNSRARNPGGSYWLENIVVITGDVFIEGKLQSAREVLHPGDLLVRIQQLSATPGRGPSIDPKALGELILQEARLWEGRHRPKGGFNWGLALPELRTRPLLKLFFRKKTWW